MRHSSEGLAGWLKNMPGCTVYEGHARFEGSHTVRVDGERLEAEKIFIDTGARAFIPDIPGLNEIDYLTNSTMMDMGFLPEHLIIVGGSHIGLEFAQMYRRFGSRVTIVEMRDRLIARDDDDVSDDGAGRARVRAQRNQGFMKIQIDAESERIPGAALLGIGGGEVIHSILDIMYADAPYTTIQRAMHIHPTVTELIPTMPGDLKPLE